LLSADYKRLLFEAAFRIGSNGDGKDGVTGYFGWIIQYHPRVAIQQLSRILVLEHYLGEMPNEPCTAEELDRSIRDYIGTHPNAGSTNVARADSRLFDTVHLPRHRRGVSSRQDWNWTGRNDEIGILMRMAVEKPQLFCRLIGKAFLSVPKNKRRTRPCHT
jgi:hypothetical protein